MSRIRIQSERKDRDHSGIKKRVHPVARVKAHSWKRVKVQYRTGLKSILEARS